jgi:glutamate formiminotransferase / 5-formyltetrahydrofolate cyclo-ligase
MTVECVVNISEGRDDSVVEGVALVAGPTLLDVHSDPDHHRSVLTLGGSAFDVVVAARAVVREACALIDMRVHRGVHPRLGAADVVPFVALDGPLDQVISLRDDFARWAGQDLHLPCFLYGPERSLPTVRREAFRSADPDTGPRTPHPTAGAAAIGARPVLVAYNVWVIGPDEDAASALALARQVARTVRGSAVRGLGLPVGNKAQVSCNLIQPHSVGPVQVYDMIARAVAELGGSVDRAELVGLVPADVLAAVPEHRHRELDVSQERTIEARLESTGQMHPSFRRR